MRSAVLLFLLASLAAPSLGASPLEDYFVEALADDLPPLLARALPGRGHRLLDALAGEWSVEKSLFVAAGISDEPTQSTSMTTRREWIANGRFLRDVTEGSLDGQPYSRTGLLGYNTMDDRYEWVTADSLTPALMIYQAQKGSAVYMPISMRGTFTDLGVTGEANVGKAVAMRTVITIESPNRHVFDVYFAPPGGREQLADRMIFTRVTGRR